MAVHTYKAKPPNWVVRWLVCDIDISSPGERELAVVWLCIHRLCWSGPNLDGNHKTRTFILQKPLTSVSVMNMLTYPKDGHTKVIVVFLLCDSHKTCFSRAEP